VEEVAEAVHPVDLCPLRVAGLSADDLTVVVDKDHESCVVQGRCGVAGRGRASRLQPLRAPEEEPMAPHADDPPLSQEERRKVFLALVEAQDSGLTVLQSRKVVAKRFGLTDRQVRAIEEEGLDGQWPPLDA
jgi:hypothetical protein